MKGYITTPSGRVIPDVSKCRWYSEGFGFRATCVGRPRTEIDGKCDACGRPVIKPEYNAEGNRV